MSRTIDEKVVFLEFDNSNFEKNTKKTLNLLDTLKEKLNFNGASKGLDQIDKLSNKITFGTMNDGVITLTGNVSALDIIAQRTLTNIVDSAYRAGTSLVKSFTIDPIAQGWTKMDQMTGSVQTLVNSTGKTVDEIKGYLSDLMWFSDETSYGFTDMTSALATMASAGGDIETLIPMIMGIANATAYAGKGASEFQRVIYNLNQSYSQGALTAMDWKSVALAGVNSKQLKQSFIDTAEELGVIEEGMIDITNFETTLKDKWVTSEVMEETFKKWGSMSTEAKRLIDQGYFDTASEAYEALTGYFDEYIERGAKAAQEAKTFGEAMASVGDAVSSKWTTIFETIFGDYNQQVTTWTNLANNLWEIFAEPLERFNSGLSEIFSSKWSSDDGLLKGIKTIYGIGSGDFNTGFTNYLREVLGLGEEERYIIDDLLIEYKDLRRIFSHGKLDTQYLRDYLSTLEEVEYETENLTEEELVKLTDDLNTAWDNIENSFDSIGQLSGTELLAESLENIFNLVLGIKSMFTDAWDEASGGNEGGSIFKSLLGILYTITSTITEVVTKSELLRGIIRVIVTLVNQVGNAIKYTIVKVLDTINWFLQLFNIDLEGINSVIKSVFDKIIEFLSVNNIFIEMLKVIYGFIENILLSIKEAYDRFINTPTMQRFLQSITSFLDKIKEAISSINSDIVNSGIEFITTSIANALNSILGFITTIGSYIYKSKFIQTIVTEIKNAIESISNYLNNSNVQSFLNDVGNVLKTIGGFLFAIYNYVKQLLIQFYQSEKVQTFITNLKNMFESLKESFKAIDFSAIKDSLISLYKDLISGKINPFEMIKKSIEIVWKNLKTFIENSRITIKDFFTDLKNDILSFFKDNDIEDRFRSFIEILLGVGGGYLVLTNIGKALDGLTTFLKPLDVLTNIGDNFADLLSSCSGYIKSLTAGHIVNNVLKLAIALGILAAAIYIMSKIDPSGLKELIKIMLGLVLAFTVIAIVLEKLGKIDEKKAVGFLALGQLLIKFAESILILSISLKLIGSTKNLLGSFLAIIGLMGGIVVSLIALSTLTKGLGEKKATAISNTLIKYALSILILSVSLRLLDNIKPDRILTSIVGLAGIVGALFIISKIIDKMDPNQGSAKELILYAASMLIFMYAIKKLANMDVKKYFKGLALLIPLFAILVIVSNSLKVVAKKSQSTGAYIVALATALILVAKAVKTLSKIDFLAGIKAIFFAGLLLAGLSFLMIVLSHTMKNTTASLKSALGMAVVIVAVSAALYLVAGAVYLFGNMRWQTVLQGVAAVAAIMIAFGRMIKLMSSFQTNKYTLKSLIGIIGILVTLVASIVVLSLIDFPKLAQSIGAMIILLGAVTGMMYVLGIITKTMVTTKAGVLRLIEMVATMIVFIAAMTGVIYLLSKIQNVDQATNSLLKISAVMAIMSLAMSVLAPLATSIVASQGLILLGLAGIEAIIIATIAIIAWIASKLTVDESLIDKLDFASRIMQKIGEMIGGFFGGLVGGFAGGALDSFTSKLESAGTHLSNFMDSIKGFIENLKTVSEEDLDKAKLVAEMIVTMGSLSTIAAVNRLISEESVLNKLGGEDGVLTKYGTAIVAFSDQIKGKIDSAAVQAAADAGKMLAELSNAMPKESGGLWGWLAGNKQSIADFGKDMVSFAESLVEIGSVMNGSDAKAGFDQSAIEKAKVAGDMMNALVGTLGESTSLKSLIAGGNNTDLKTFGNQIKSYVQSLVDVGELFAKGNFPSDENINQAIHVGEAMNGLAAQMGEGTSLFSLVKGGNKTNIAQFGQQIRVYINHILTAGERIAKGSFPTVESLDKAVNVGERMNVLVAQMGESTSLSALLKGGNKTTIDQFGSQIAGYCASLSTASIYLMDMQVVSDDKLTSAVSMSKAFAEIVTSINNVNPETGLTLSTLGNQIVSYVKSLSETSNIVNTLGEASYLFTTLQEYIVSTFEFIKETVTTQFGILLEYLKVLVSSGKGGKGNKFKECMDTVIKYFDRRSDALEAGKNTLHGLYDGLTDSYWLEQIRQAGVKAANIFNEAYRTTLDEHSPSRVMAENGWYTVQGLIIGIESQYGKVWDAGETTGNIMLSSIAKSVELADQIVEEGVQPVITPVLDLSQVQDGMNGLNGSIIQNGVRAQGIGMYGNKLNGTMQPQQNTFNIDFNIDNGGKDITEADISSWSRKIVQLVNTELGMKMS